MPDIPEAAVQAALAADYTAAYEDATPERPFDAECLTRIAVEAAAPVLAEHVAKAIFDHMEEHGPQAGTPLGGTMRRAWRRHFTIAARVAGLAFSTEEDIKRRAAEAFNRGDYTACRLDEAGNSAGPKRED